MDSMNDVYFVLALFVPGFVYWSVLRQFVPLRKLDGSESLLLSYLSTTVLMYALWSPFILWVMSATTASHIVASPFLILVIFCSLVLIGPSVLAALRAYTIQHDLFSGLLAKLNLRTLHPIPTAWDWKFSRTAPSYVLVTLIDGKIIAGWLGVNSLAAPTPTGATCFWRKCSPFPQTVRPGLKPRALRAYISTASKLPTSNSGVNPMSKNGSEKFGHRPLTEGYQPLNKGFQPVGSAGPLPPPPSGGSSVMTSTPPPKSANPSGPATSK